MSPGLLDNSKLFKSFATITSVVCLKLKLQSGRTLFSRRLLKVLSKYLSLSSKDDLSPIEDMFVKKSLKQLPNSAGHPLKEHRH